MFTNINHKNLSTVIAILVAIFTTGYLRIHWIPFLPESDGGLYERVAIISYSPNVYYKTIVGDIYRLKSFKQ